MQGVTRVWMNERTQPGLWFWYVLPAIVAGKVTLLGFMMPPTWEHGTGFIEPYRAASYCILAWALCAVLWGRLHHRGRVRMQSGAGLLLSSFGIFLLLVQPLTDMGWRAGGFGLAAFGIGLALVAWASRADMKR